MAKMKQVNSEKINNLLADSLNVASCQIDKIINKSKSLAKLTLEESAILLNAQDTDSLDKIFSAASFVKEQIYGRRVVLFAPLYINNFCSNNCAYCAFKSDNRLLKRKALNTDEIKQQTQWLLERGHKRILMVSSEGAPGGKSSLAARSPRPGVWDRLAQPACMGRAHVHRPRRILARACAGACA